MNTITRNAIKDSILENFSAYPEDYPITENAPNEEAIGQLVRWVENEWAEASLEETIEDWFEVATAQYLYCFNLTEEWDKNWDLVEESIKRQRS